MGACSDGGDAIAAAAAVAASGGSNGGRYCVQELYIVQPIYPIAQRKTKIPH